MKGSGGTWDGQPSGTKQGRLAVCHSPVSCSRVDKITQVSGSGWRALSGLVAASSRACDKAGLLARCKRLVKSQLIVRRGEAAVLSG